MALVIVAIAETTFVQGLVTAACSAFISGTFLLISVRITSKKTDEKVEKAKTEILQGQEIVKDVVTDVVAGKGDK